MPLKELFIIDDDVEDQELFLAALKKVDESFIYHTASNGEEAYTKLTEKKVSPDLILLDLNMPLMDGTGFLKKIKSNDQLKDIPVIIFSTSSITGNTNDIFALGAVDFITKPSSFTALQHLLQQTLQRYI